MNEADSPDFVAGASCTINVGGATFEATDVKVSIARRVLPGFDPEESTIEQRGFRKGSLARFIRDLKALHARVALHDAGLVLGEADHDFGMTLTPDGWMRSTLGVFVWRMLGELQAPLLRRHANGSMWRRALRASQGRALEYLMGVDADGAPIEEKSP